MENIFIDTCIYQEGQFIASGKLKTLFDAAKEGRICILLPDITEREVLAHIEEQYEKNLQNGNICYESDVSVPY